MTVFGWILLITFLLSTFVIAPKLMKLYIENEDYRQFLVRLFVLPAILISFSATFLLRFRLVVCAILAIAIYILLIVISEIRIRRK